MDIHQGTMMTMVQPPLIPSSSLIPASKALADMLPAAVEMPGVLVISRYDEAHAGAFGEGTHPFTDHDDAHHAFNDHQDSRTAFDRPSSSFDHDDDNHITLNTSSSSSPSSSSSTAAHFTEDIDWSSAPELAPDGSSGVYFLKNHQGRTCAVFKPLDEEVGAANNPRITDTRVEDLPPGFSPGLGFLNEYAAYSLDCNMFGTSGSIVPETLVVSVPWGFHDDGTPMLKFGSIQKFVPGGEDVCDFGSGLFTVEDVQHIAVLDLRILNCDRHFSNLLAVRDTTGNNQVSLKAIDHGYAFPSAFNQLGLVSFDWMLWPQAKQSITPAIKEAIAAIDLDRDIEMLADLGVAKEAQLALWMSTTLLKLGAEAGLTLYEIGSMVQRSGSRTESSTLELVFILALEAFTVNEKRLGFAPSSFEDAGERFALAFRQFAADAIASLANNDDHPTPACKNEKM